MAAEKRMDGDVKGVGTAFKRRRKAAGSQRERYRPAQSVSSSESSCETARPHARGKIATGAAESGRSAQKDTASIKCSQSGELRGANEAESSLDGAPTREKEKSRTLLGGRDSLRGDATRAPAILGTKEDPSDTQIRSAVQKPSRFGPQRESMHIRTTVRIDYQPDVCKDFWETGYCTFGDACKFLHDRGSQAPKDARDRVKQNENGDAELGSAKKDPFGCFLCRKTLRNSVRTICGHLFCEPCALNRMRSDSTCAVCGKETGGLFNAVPAASRSGNTI